MSNPHHDAEGIELPDHLPAFHDETGKNICENKVNKTTTVVLS